MSLWIRGFWCINPDDENAFDFTAESFPPPPPPQLAKSKGKTRGMNNFLNPEYSFMTAFSYKYPIICCTNIVNPSDTVLLTNHVTAPNHLALEPC